MFEWAGYGVRNLIQKAEENFYDRFKLDSDSDDNDD